MSSARNPPKQGFPAVPPTLVAGNYDMHEYDTDQTAPPSTIPYYTPYLGLRARLSQVWINRWTILLLLIIVRLLLAIQDINRAIGSAKDEALSACTSVESVGSAMASMPHYLSQGVNALAADGITNAVAALMKMVLLTVTGVEEIILFYINMLTSTYVCLITLVIGGSLSAAIEMIEKVGDFFNTTISSLTGDLTKDASDFENSLNSFLSKISIPAFLGGSSSAPKIDLSSGIAKLNGITVDPTQFDAELTKLNASIPTFDEVHNFTNTIIRLPFEEIKTLINESLPAYTFDKSVFPVPQKKALTFCSGNPKIVDFFAGLIKTVEKAKIIFIVILAIVAALVCIPMAWMEIRRYRAMQKRITLFGKYNYDGMDITNIVQRPYTSTFGITAASKFKSTKAQILTRWFVAYITSYPALFVLSLGLAGLLSCACQLIILRVIQREVPVIAQEVGGFADEVVYALGNASESWAVDANQVITSTGAKINNDLFGWVNTSTVAVNDTFNGFTDKMNEALNATFGGTVLQNPVNGLVNCLIGIKIAGIEQGLTWVHDNAHINFPTFRPDVFSLGAVASLTNSSADDSFLADPGDVTSDGITSAIAKVTNKLEDGLRTETIISASLIGLYVFIILLALARVIVGMLSRDKTRAEGGPVGYTGDNRGSLTPRSPNRNSHNFPTFGGPVSSIRPDTSARDGAWGDNPFTVGDEKVRGVARKSVEASVKPGHERVSSYGYLDEKH